MKRIMMCTKSKFETREQRMGLKTVQVKVWTCHAQTIPTIGKCYHCGPHEENNACKYKIEGSFLCNGVCTECKS